MPEEVLGINSALQNYSSYSCDSAAETGIFLHSHAGCWFRLVQQHGAGGAPYQKKSLLWDRLSHRLQRKFPLHNLHRSGWAEAEVILRSGWFLGVRREYHVQPITYFLALLLWCLPRSDLRPNASTVSKGKKSSLNFCLQSYLTTSVTLGILALFINVLGRINSWLALSISTLQMGTVNWN